MEPHLTADDLGEILRRTGRSVLELVRKEKWPHVKTGKQITFTREQVAQIVAAHTKGGEVVEAPALGGQTTRSRARAS
jgi:arsenate reductase-like glutaredoxin family protein